MRGVPRDRRASSAAARVDNRHVQNARRPLDDLLQVDLVVEVQAMDDAEARAQRPRQQPGARRRANQRELLQRHLDRSRARALADHDVELVVLHRGIEHFLDRRRHPVDLVDEEHFVLAEARQDGGEIAGRSSTGPGCRAHSDAELLPDDVGQRRLAKAGRAVEQDVIERFAPLPCRRDRDLKIRANALLADVVVQRAGPKPRFVLSVFIDPGSCNDPRVGHAGGILWDGEPLSNLRFDFLDEPRPHVRAVVRGPERIVPLSVGDACSAVRPSTARRPDARRSTTEP